MIIKLEKMIAELGLFEVIYITNIKQDILMKT